MTYLPVWRPRQGTHNRTLAASVCAVTPLLLLLGLLPAYASTAVAAGTYENTSPALTLVGGWTTTTSSMDSGGSHSRLAEPGYAQVSFSTSGIKWVARKNANAGLADVYVDGVKKATVDLYSATTTYQQTVYEISGLSETSHTLRVVRTGLRNPSSGGAALLVDAFVAPDIYPPSAPIDLRASAEATGARLNWTPSPDGDLLGYRIYRQGPRDASRVNVTPNPTTATAFADTGLQPGTTYAYQVAAVDTFRNESPLTPAVSVTMPISAQGAGTYQSTSEAVTLVGPWSTIASTVDSGGSHSRLSAPGYAEFSFATSGVKVLGRKNANAGLADIYVDGVKKATVDLYAPTTTYQHTLYEVAGLPETNHTVRVVRTGKRNPASGGYNIMIDAFVAPDIHPPNPPLNVKASPDRTGARLTWTPSTSADVASYTVYRQEGVGTAISVGRTNAATHSFSDIGLPGATSYTYQVLATDNSGNRSSKSVPAKFVSPEPAPETSLRYSACPNATMTVSNRAELLSALSRAQAGSVIRLQAGVYLGGYNVAVKATKAAPLWICGSRDAVIDGGTTTEGKGFRVDSSSHVVLAGMTVRNVLKGITVINSSNITVADTSITKIGDEGIHLRTNTTDSTVIGNVIDGVGLVNPAYGEGVYVGSSEGNWCLFSSCMADRSDRNTISRNVIRNTTAQPIDIKEGASHGAILHNVLYGGGMSVHSDSLISIQSNDWVIAGNTGTDTRLDAVQVWEHGPGWGLNNVAYDNHFHGSIPGYGIRLAYRELGNFVGCDNTVPTGAAGLSNKACQL